MKKIFAIATTLTVAAMIAGPGTAQALTAADLQAQINALLAQLSTLQNQLAQLQGTSTTPGGSCTFTRNLYPGMSGADVKCLQQYLNGAGFTLSASGAGSPGNETEYFGSRTQGAVQRWQDANGVVYGNYGGYFGPKSIAKYNTLGPGPGTVCGNGVCETGETAANCATDCGTITPGTGGLTVSLAYDTPASTVVPDNGVANFTKFSLTASSSGDVNVSKIYVTRSGLSANSDIENIKIVDVSTGTYTGSIGSLNVDNRAMITFVPELVIDAGTTRSFYIRASIKNDATGGLTAILSIASNDDIVSDATSVSGAPVAGNAMEVVSLTIGTATVSEITITDMTPDVGDTDVSVLEFKVAVGSTEPITIETITVKKAGTADATDTNNIELYSITDSKSLGEVSSWDSEEKATWDNLNLIIGKGDKHRFRVRLDIVDGVASTAKKVDADLVDGSDVLMVVKGNTYGSYLDPDRVSSWDGLGEEQTINAGALTITKSANTPATGNISPGDDIEVSRWDFEAKGESIKLTALGLDLDFGIPGMLNWTDISNVSLYDEDGDVAAGPVDPSVEAGTVSFTDTFIVPVGIHEYYVTMTIADSADTGGTITAGIDISTTLAVAAGMTSGDTITVTPDSTEVVCNTMTLAAGALNVVTLSYPPTRTIPDGTTDFVWATFSLDAVDSGEDVNVTAITVTDSYAVAGDTDNIDNAELWADLTDETSHRGDIYDTKVSDTKQWADSTGTQAFTMTQTITVTAGTFVKLALVADLAASATGNYTFSIADDNLTATGAETGESITPTYDVTDAQTISEGSATLTISQDTSFTRNQIVVEHETATIGVFRLASDNVEDLDLDVLRVNVTAADAIDTLYFYNEDNLLISKPPTDLTTVQFSDGTLSIPADGHKEITIKAKFKAVDGTTVANAAKAHLALSVNNSVETTGFSGAAVDSGTNAASSPLSFIYESRPYFSVNSNSPSGDLYPSSSDLVAIFDITAADTEDISFENTDANSIRLEVSGYAADTTAEQLYFTFKDAAGDTLCTSQTGHGQTADGGSTSSQTISTYVLCGFADKSFYIGAGQTEQVYVYLDTTEFEDNGDQIQLWLDDGNATQIDWGIDKEESHNMSGIILRGDIYAGSQVNPS